MELSLRPMFADFKYRDKQYILSSLLILDETACGSRGLKNKISPGLNEMHFPKCGKQK